METRLGKVAVINPMEMVSTVGAELQGILNNIDFNDTLLQDLFGDKDLCSIEKIAKPDLKKICQSAMLDNCIFDYLVSFQKDYFIQKKKIEKAYNCSLRLFRDLDRKLSPLIANENFQGMDRLEDFTIFLDVDDERLIDKKIEDKNKALFKQSCRGEYDQFNLYAWLRKGEIDFEKIENKASYDANGLQKWVEAGEWRNNLSNLDYIYKLPNIFAHWGVVVVYTPSLPSVPYGASRWFEDIPMIQISDREKDIAIFWKVLFHEIAHVLKHKGVISLNDINKSSSKKIEKEADDYAKQLLYNGDALRTYVYSQKLKWCNAVEEDKISRKFGVDKIFVNYWLRKARKTKMYVNHKFVIVP